MEQYNPAEDYHTLHLWLPNETDENAHFDNLVAALDAAGIKWEIA